MGPDRPAVKNLSPILDPTHLAVARFPAHWRPSKLPSGFAGVVYADDEVTLVCAESAFTDGSYDGVRPIELEHGWRRVTFPGPLPWEQVGFLADVATRLADAQIPFTSMAGFTTDHVLVRAAQADLAVAVLSGQPAPAQRPGTNP